MAPLDAGKSPPHRAGWQCLWAFQCDTVESAYSQLHAEGFIERRVGSGSVVSGAVRHLPKRSVRQRSGSLLQQARLSQRGAAMVQVEAWVSPDAASVRAGVPETRSFPLQIWERLQRQVLKEYGTKARPIATHSGNGALRRAIADYINLERGSRHA